MSVTSLKTLQIYKNKRMLITYFIYKCQFLRLAEYRFKTN